VKRALLVLAVSLAALPRAGAAASRVVLLRSGSGDALARQAETLLGAELRASGFEVVTRERASDQDLRADIEAAAGALRPIAVLAIAAAGEAAAEIWLSDRVTGKLVIRRIDAGGDGDAAASLALRAVELLRGSLLEITVEAPLRPEARPTLPPDVARFVASTAPGHRAWFVEGLGLSLGAAVFGTPTSLGPTYAPALRLSYGARRRLCVRLSVMGPGSVGQASVHDGEALVGTARVHQDLLLLEAMLAFRREARIQPFLSAGAGLHRVRVAGTGGSPLFPGNQGTSLGAALDAGAGLALRLGNRAALVLEAHAVGILPATDVAVADQRAVRVGPFTAVGAAGLFTAF
jgi:hypothetical protein